MVNVARSERRNAAKEGVKEGFGFGMAPSVSAVSVLISLRFACSPPEMANHREENQRM